MSDRRKKIEQVLRELRTNIKLKISFAFLLAFCAFVIVQVLSNQSIYNLKKSFQQISESRELSKMIGAVGSSIKSYHSKVTEFVLTGNDRFLDGNEENLRDANINLQHILEAKISPEQQVLVNQLDSLVGAEIEFCQQSLIAYDKENRTDAITQINSGKGEQLVDEITRTSRQVRDIEEANLAQIIRNNDSFSTNVTQLDYAATAFAAAVMLFSVFILFRDINKRVRIEKQLRVAQQHAEQSAIMKEQFMANMSHEIRTPMNAIIGFSDLLAKSNLDEEQRKHINAIQSSGENLLTIINDILDFSKIEEGMLRIEKIPFSPAALLHSLNVMFLPRAFDKNIQLNFYTAPALPEAVVGDPTRLTQILVNLIGNAMKFTNEGSISVKAELLKEETTNVLIRFTVKDTGIGIPEDKVDEIFERFSQANADTNRKYGGTGLGLSIARKLIELHGGTIRVESAEHVGSSFSFDIPYKKAVHVNSEEELSPAIPLAESKAKILVAEDNLLNQKLTAELLSSWGFAFEIVESGKQLLEKLRLGSYDLILMDIQMPEMNGYEAAQFIRQELKLQLPIIAMTAHVLPGEKDKCLSYGMTDYISKPIRANELNKLLNKHLNARTLPENKTESIANAAIPMGNVTDLSYVNELAQGNILFVGEMIDLFLSENPQEIQRLETAINNQEMESIGAIAHKINSTVPFVGLNKIIGDRKSVV